MPGPDRPGRLRTTGPRGQPDRRPIVLPWRTPDVGCQHCSSPPFLGVLLAIGGDGDRAWPARTPVVVVGAGGRARGRSRSPMRHRSGSARPSVARSESASTRHDRRPIVQGLRSASGADDLRRHRRPSRTKAPVKAVKPKAKPATHATPRASTVATTSGSRRSGSARRAVVPCSRSRPPDAGVYRWGCAGPNNVYLLGMPGARSSRSTTPTSTAGSGRACRSGYADGHGRRPPVPGQLADGQLPSTAASWAWAGQSPSRA